MTVYSWTNVEEDALVKTLALVCIYTNPILEEFSGRAIASTFCSGLLRCTV